MTNKLFNTEPEELTPCSACGAFNPKNAEYCEACGFSTKPKVDEQQISRTENKSAGCEIYGNSFIGRRNNNEDSFTVYSSEVFHNNKKLENYLLAVADGIGGNEHGERASQLATEIIANALGKSFFYLIISMETANTMIYEEAKIQDSDMGSTIIATLIHDNEVSVAWAGDSPLYHIRGEKIIYRTEEHTVVNRLLEKGEITEEEAKKHPERSFITKSLGVEGFIYPSQKILKLEPGDYLLLCSDGLSSFITDDDIVKTIKKSLNVQDACNTLISKAVEKNSNDNVTAILAKYKG